MRDDDLDHAACDQEEKKDDGTGVETVESRRGMLKRLINHYSSTPITEESLTTAHEQSMRTQRCCLTSSERDFLEQLVRDGDLTTMEAASIRLVDLFRLDDVDESTPNADSSLEDANEPVTIVRRNSVLQQQLYRLHQTHKVSSSRALQQMSLIHKNSILEDAENDFEQAVKTEASTDGNSLLSDDLGSSISNSTNTPADLEVASWIDGGVGFEVTQDNEVMTKRDTETKAAFRILGTTADDASCHPHVLTPPLMESLLAFLPESLTDYNFFLKYSLARDGASLWTLLRKSRASVNCFLAVETTLGYVFGAFTSQPWRVSQGWWGTKDTFLFKLRHSRLENVSSIMKQVKNESDIQVYPYRSGNVALLHCSKSGIMLGQEELLPPTQQGEHLGYALFLDPSLRTGTTSTSETFGNPCLVSQKLRGASFDVANIEVWTLTPHETVEEAERAELTSMFLEGGQKKLSLMDIIVGGTI